jgi:hypothetical protein
VCGGGGGYCAGDFITKGKFKRHIVSANKKFSKLVYTCINTKNRGGLSKNRCLRKKLITGYLGHSGYYFPVKVEIKD